MHRLTEKAREFVWDDDCAEAFQDLKNCLQESPVLKYLDPEADYILDTDASGVGIGAVLSQVTDGQEKVVSYASRAL